MEFFEWQKLVRAFRSFGEIRRLLRLTLQARLQGHLPTVLPFFAFIFHAYVLFKIFEYNSLY